MPAISLLFIFNRRIAVLAAAIVCACDKPTIVISGSGGGGA